MTPIKHTKCDAEFQPDPTMPGFMICPKCGDLIQTGKIPDLQLTKEVVDAT